RVAKRPHRGVRAGTTRAPHRDADRRARLAGDGVQPWDHGRARGGHRGRTPRPAEPDRQLAGGNAMTTVDTRSAIIATVRAYFEGWYDGDAARMERALPPGLAKRSPEGESPDETPAAWMIDATAR